MYMDTNMLPSLRPLYMKRIVKVARERSGFLCPRRLNIVLPKLGELGKLVQVNEN